MNQVREMAPIDQPTMWKDIFLLELGDVWSYHVFAECVCVDAAFVWNGKTL
jgi:hypothetical protein